MDSKLFHEKKLIVLFVVVAVSVVSYAAYSSFVKTEAPSNEQQSVSSDHKNISYTIEGGISATYRRIR